MRIRTPYTVRWHGRACGRRAPARRSDEAIGRLDRSDREQRESARQKLARLTELGWSLQRVLNGLVS